MITSASPTTVKLIRAHQCNSILATPDCLLEQFPGALSHVASKDRETGMAILRAIYLLPACTGRAARHASRIHPSKFYPALDALIACGAVSSYWHGKSQHLFIPQPGLDQCWRQVEALRNHPDLWRIHAWVSEQGGCPRHELLRHAGIKWGWPVTKTKRRIKLLLDVQLLSVTTSLSSDQRQAWLSALSPPEPAMGLLWSANLIFHQSPPPIQDTTVFL